MRSKLHRVLLELNIVVTNLGKCKGVKKPYINTDVWLKEDEILREIEKATKFIKHPEYSYLKK